MGGLAGRIKYLYEGDITFLELKAIIENISKNNISLFEKIDGFNCYFSCRRGIPVIARNLTEAQAGGLSIIELSNREFQGGSKVKKVFIEALKNFSNDFKLLDKNVFESNGKQIFYNFEIVDKKTNRLFEYDNNGLILHNSGHFYIEENKKHFINCEMFKNESVDTKYIKQNFKTSLKENSQINSEIFIRRIESLAITNGLMFEDSILKLKENNELKKIINEFSNSLMNSLKSNFVNNQDEKVEHFKRKVKEAVDSLLEYSGPDRAQIIEKTIHYLNQFPTIDSINSCIEGVVFEHKNEIYKLNGYYGPINQLYGFYQKTLNEFDSGKMYPIEPNSYNVDGVLTHPQEKTIAVFPGSFKPPHAGHYRIVDELKNLKTPDGFHICNKIIILISNKARIAQSDSKTTYITADMAKELWDLYISNEDAQTRIEVRVTEHDTPIKGIYELMLNEMSPGETLLLVKSDKDSDSDRFNAFEDFSKEYDLGIKVIQQGMNIFSAGISASNMRNWIADGNSEQFKGFLPDHLSSTDRDRAWEIVSGGEEVSLSTENSFFLKEIYNSFLEEGEGDKRLASALRKYPQYKEQIEIMAEADPSGKGLKLLPWMVRQLVNFDGGRANDIIAVISLFWQYRQRFEAAGYSTDIFSYSFEEMLELLKKSKLTPRLDKIKSPLRTSKYPGSSIIYEDEDHAVIRPYTFDASCYFGEKDIWCISTTSQHWNNYVDENSVHYILINDSVEFEEDPNSKIDFVVKDNQIVELWDKNNKSLEEEYVKEILGDKLYNKIEEEIITDYDLNPSNEPEGNYKEWIKLSQEIEEDNRNSKYIYCEVVENGYNQDDYWIQASFHLDLNKFGLNFISHYNRTHAERVRHIFKKVLNIYVDDIDILDNRLIANINLQEFWDIEQAKWYWYWLKNKDEELQDEDSSNNINSLIYAFVEEQLIEDNDVDSKIEILRQIEDYEFEYLFPDFDDEEGLNIQFILYDLYLPILPEQYVVYKEGNSFNSNLKRNSFQNMSIARQTFDRAEIKMHTQNFLKEFGIPYSLSNATNMEFINGDTSYAIVDEQLNINTFAVKDGKSIENYNEVSEKTAQVVSTANNDPNFLGNGMLVEFRSKDGNLVNLSNGLIKFYIEISIPKLLQISMEEINELLEKLIKLDKSGKIPEFRSKMKQLMIDERMSIINSEIAHVEIDDIARRFIHKYYLSNNLEESFVEQILEKCEPNKTIFMWTSPDSKESDKNFLEVKLKGRERGIDTSGLYYANMNELFMLENGLIEEEINGKSSEEYAVIPKMNTKAHWYFNNLKSENKLASRSLGQFHLLMENRIDFLIKTYREKIFQKLLDQLTQLTAAELSHLGWTWASDLIFQSTIGPSQVNDPQAGKNLLNLLNEFDPKEKDTLADQAFEFFVDTDPSQKKKYVQWLIFKFLKDDERIEDIWTSKGNLELFDEMSRRNIIRGVDINSLSFKELRELVEEHEGELSGRQQAGKSQNEKEFIIKNEMNILFQQDEYIMAIPKTKRASCLLGSKTEWCTASRGERNMFDWYNDDGELIIFITPEEKRQLHIASQQFKDEDDRDDQLLGWIEQESIFKKPFLKYLLDNGYDEKLEKTDLYSQYFSTNRMMTDLSIFIFKETLTTEKALKVLERESLKKDNVASIDYSGTIGGKERNKILFYELWNAGTEDKKYIKTNLDKLKRRWVRKVANSFSTLTHDRSTDQSVSKITNDFGNFFIELMPPELFEKLVIPEFFQGEERSLKKAFIHQIGISALSVTPEYHSENGIKNYLILIENTITHEKSLKKHTFDKLIESLSTNLWIKEIIQRPILLNWFSSLWPTLDREKRARVSFNILFSNNDKFIDKNSFVGKIFIPKIKETIEDYKKDNSFPPSIFLFSHGTVIGTVGVFVSFERLMNNMKIINNFDPEIIDIWVDTFINAIQNSENSPEKLRTASSILMNLSDIDGNYLNVGPPQFKKLIEPIKNYLNKNYLEER